MVQWSNGLVHLYCGRTDEEGTQGYDIKRVVAVSKLYDINQYLARKDVSILSQNVSIRLRPGPKLTPLHSCAEPNLITFDFGGTADSEGVLAGSPW